MLDIKIIINNMISIRSKPRLLRSYYEFVNSETTAALYIGRAMMLF